MEAGDLVEVDSKNELVTTFFAGLRGRIAYVTSRTHPVGGTLIIVDAVFKGDRRSFDFYSNDLRVVTGLDLLVEALDAPAR